MAQNRVFLYVSTPSRLCRSYGESRNRTPAKADLYCSLTRELCEVPIIALQSGGRVNNAYVIKLDSSSSENLKNF